MWSTVCQHAVAPIFHHCCTWSASPKSSSPNFTDIPQLLYLKCKSKKFESQISPTFHNCCTWSASLKSSKSKISPTFHNCCTWSASLKSSSTKFHLHSTTAVREVQVQRVRISSSSPKNSNSSPTWILCRTRVLHHWLTLLELLAIFCRLQCRLVPRLRQSMAVTHQGTVSWIYTSTR